MFKCDWKTVSENGPQVPNTKGAAFHTPVWYLKENCIIINIIFFLSLWTTNVMVLYWFATFASVILLYFEYI